MTAAEPRLLRTAAVSDRCIDGRLYRHHPVPDDPDYERDMGECPHVLDGQCDCPHKLPDFIPE